jgi:hypothetical protein
MDSNYFESGGTMIRVGDIDIDVADRDQILQHFDHTPASRVQNDLMVKHNTGVYVTDIPSDPVSKLSSIEYQAAEDRGYVKLDIINNSVYRLVESRQHLNQLLKQTPNWAKLQDPGFFQKIVHIGAHYDLSQRLREPLQSIDHMAMFLALIRPAKRHLVGQLWSDIARDIWKPDPNGVYGFKKSHSYSYAHLVVVHMNLLS